MNAGSANMWGALFLMIIDNNCIYYICDWKNVCVCLVKYSLCDYCQGYRLCFFCDYTSFDDSPQKTCIVQRSYYIYIFKIQWLNNKHSRPQTITIYSQIWLYADLPGFPLGCEFGNFSLSKHDGHARHDGSLDLISTKPCNTDTMSCEVHDEVIHRHWEDIII